MQPRSLTVSVSIETWPIRQSFVISRGAKREAVVVVAVLHDGQFSGQGECVPYSRYGETPQATVAAIEATIAAHPTLDRSALQRIMPPGAARNALDCALWALEAASADTAVNDMIATPLSAPVLTCQTISLASPSQMAATARQLSTFPLLKLKLGAAGDSERMQAVRAARPDARLVGDANEGWAADDLQQLLDVAAAARFETIEQPLPVGQDGRLAEIVRPLPVCADESAHTADGLEALSRCYDAVNIKLDKTGGLTAALEMARRARELRLDIMVGCMVSTSLSMAPALHLAPFARWVDLDGPLLLTRDRDPGLSYSDAWISPPDRTVWA